MWVFLNNAFLSIVAHDLDDELLHIRARFEGDIESVFPEAEVAETQYGDYRFRTSLRRERVSDRLAQLAHEIEYTNFKSSVTDAARKQSYIKVWELMWQEQDKRSGGDL